MDRVILSQEIEVGQELLIEGPPLEALLFQGGRAGSLVTLTDVRRKDFRGRVLRVSKETASVYVFDGFPYPVESPVEIILLQALPEKERMELIIQKTTELGVSRIIPFKSERSTSLEEREAKQKKAHRWQEIAVKAVQQSRRARVPSVEEYGSFEKALEVCEEDGLKILLWEKEGGSLKEVLNRFFTTTPPFDKEGMDRFKANRQGRIYVMVGPEGGLADDEVVLAKKRGFVPVKLGQRILRTETAAIALVGILQYELGDLG